MRISLPKIRKSIFHRHKYFNFCCTRKNKIGEIWTDECSCGQKRKIIFDSSGNCVGIQKI